MDLTRENTALKEFKGFVVDICYDYKEQPELGLQAIRILAKGKQTEEEFQRVWVRWREKRGFSVFVKEDTNGKAEV